MPLAIHGKRRIAYATYHKGSAFIAAALLLREKSGNEYVVLHLLCQGLELVLKASLLFRDYDKYRRALERRDLGHNLSRVAETARAAFGLRELPPPLAKELDHLSHYYSNHHLRYGGLADILVEPTSIASGMVLRRTVAVLRLFRRSLQGNVP